MDVVKKHKKTKQYAFSELVEGNCFSQGNRDYQKIETVTDCLGDVCNASELSTGLVVPFQPDELVTLWAVCYLVKEE